MHSTFSLRLDDVALGALAPISLAVAPGKVTCLSGRSGIGKSRLLRAVADIEAHDGRVYLGDTEQASLPAHEWRRRVMLVPAESQWWSERVGEHFHEGGGIAGLDELGFDAEVFNWSVSRLSSGEKQRLAILRALSVGPMALLLDEPTANLDQESTENLERWLLSRIREQQLPVLWVAHDRDQIQRVADHHFHLNGHSLEER